MTLQPMCLGSANHHMVDQTARTAPAFRDVALVKAAHEEYLTVLSKAEEHLGKTGGPYIVGKTLSVGDIPLAVELNRWSLCVHRARADGISLGCPALPHLDRYYAAMVGMPAYAEHVHAAERKHQALDESDEVRCLPQP